MLKLLLQPNLKYKIYSLFKFPSLQLVVFPRFHFEAVLLSLCARDNMCTNLPFGHNLQREDNPVASDRIPVSFVTDIDRDPSSEGYSVSEHDWFFCNPSTAQGSHGSRNEPVKGLICGWEGAVNP